jgi:hypothetical protein
MRRRRLLLSAGRWPIRATNCFMQFSAFLRKRWLLCAVVVLVFIIYVGSYLWLSRRGYAEADRYRMQGFYYFAPEDTDAWRNKNFGCVVLYWPLNAVDRLFGFGRYPAAEPLFHLSSKPL